MTSPKISIVIPSYNRATLIRQALESVLKQTYQAFELIVVDGGSTDGTLEILDEIPDLRLVSEPDRGMYDALNKGLQLAKGEIVGFLNSDDFYSEDGLGAVAAQFEKTSVDAVAGQAIYFFRRGKGADLFFRPSKPLMPPLPWREVIYGDPAFNAWFFHRRVFDRIGGFDITYRIAGDRDFLFRFALSGSPYVDLRKVIYHYRVHTGSLSLTADADRFSRVADENLRLVEQYWNVVPLKARSYLQQVRTRDTITAASRNLRTGRVNIASEYVRLGCRYDLLWLPKFVSRLCTGPFRVLGRKFGWLPPI